jgi:hypothetical protein
MPFAASAMIRKALIPNRGFLFYVACSAGDGIPVARRARGNEF